MSLETALELLATDSSFAAIEHLNSQENPTAAPEEYNELLRHLHWQEKDLFGILAIGRAGIQFGLEAAKDSSTENDTHLPEIKKRTRSLAYNLASYTWPGWADSDSFSNTSSRP